VGGFYLPLILVNSLYGLDDRQGAVTSFASALARCEMHGPFEGRAERPNHVEMYAPVFHRGTTEQRRPGSKITGPILPHDKDGPSEMSSLPKSGAVFVTWRGLTAYLRTRFAPRIRI
jgi:hypothetical protein